MLLRGEGGLDMLGPNLVFILGYLCSIKIHCYLIVQTHVLYKPPSSWPFSLVFHKPPNFFGKSRHQIFHQRVHLKIVLSSHVRAFKLLKNTLRQRCSLIESDNTMY